MSDFANMLERGFCEAVSRRAVGSSDTKARALDDTSAASVTENLPNQVSAYSSKATGFVAHAEPRLMAASVASGVPSEIMCFTTGLRRVSGCQSSRTAFAHLQTLKSHVKLASMENFCDCIGHFSRS